MTDFTDGMRSVGALGLLLGLLVAALWAVKRFNLRLPAGLHGGSSRRIEVVERMALDQKRSILLIRRDAQEHLLLLWQDGGMVIDDARAALATPHAFALQAQSAMESAMEAAGSAEPAAPPSAGALTASSVERILDLFVGAKLVKRVGDDSPADPHGMLHAA